MRLVRIAAIVWAATTIMASAACAVEVANTATGYSSVQGANGWYYLYCNSIFSGYYDPAGTYPMYYLPDKREWSCNIVYSANPTIEPGRIDLSNTTAAVLRWQADQAMKVKVSGYWYHPLFGGASVKSYIYVDGAVAYSRDCPGDYGYRNEFSFITTLQPGSNVDFAWLSSNEVVYYNAKIETVPEPPSLAGLLTAIVAAASLRLKARRAR